MEYGPFERRIPGEPANATELNRLAHADPTGLLGRPRAHAETEPGGLHDPHDAAKGGLLSPTMEERGAQYVGKVYADSLGRLAAAHEASGPEGWEAEMAKIPDAELAMTAEAADARLRRALAEGDQWVDEKGEMWGNILSDVPGNGGASGLLDVIEANRARTGQAD